MKILFVITGLGIGGAERQVCDIADNLVSRGHNVKIAYLMQPALVETKSKAVDLIWLGGEKAFIPMLLAFVNLVKLIKKEKPQVVHSHMFHAIFLARLTRIFVSFPRLICTAHNTNVGGSFRILIYRLTNALADVFTNVSQDAVDAFLEKKAVPKGGMFRVQNGIDTDYFQFSEASRSIIRDKYELKNKNVYITIGSFNEQKDYPNLLDAFDKVIAQHPNCHLLIVGDGRLRSSIEVIITDKNLQDNVTLLGIRRDIPELLSASDIYVMSSAWEGLPLVIAEAMAVEKIVVATNCGGTSELIGDDGFLVPAKDSGSLALSMEKALLLNTQAASEISSAARRKIISNYSLDSAVDKWIEIYS